MAKSKIEWHGFDLTPEMVEEARRVAKKLRRENSKIWVGSVLEDQAFSPPDGSRISFDGAVMIGVLPHIPPEDDVEVLRRLAKSVKKGGLLVAEARNALFGLFTLNRPSFNLFNDRLIDWELLKNSASIDDKLKVDVLKEALSNFFRMDRPLVRVGKKDEPGYDEVLSRSHIPFELAECARQAGWDNVEIKYCHFHILPPMFEYLIPKSYQTASLKLEDPNDWRGMIMASVFMVTGKKQC
jgi:SAM-dependent methyltransferase